MAQGDVEHQVPESNFKMGRMNGEDGHHQKPLGKRREGRPRGRVGPGGMTMDFPLRMVVPAEMVGAIIGRQGSTIHQITQETRARVDIDRKNDGNLVEKTIFIYGLPENCTEACKRILYVMKQEAANTQRGEAPLKILAHNNLIGRLIGRGGVTIQGIMSETKTKINVSSLDVMRLNNMERIITIRGDSIETAVAAEKLISTKLRESYETDLRDYSPRGHMMPGMNQMPMYPQQNNYNYNMPPGPYGYPMMPPQMGNMMPSFMGGPSQMETVYMYVHKNTVGGIIGTKGSSIRGIINYSRASVKIAPLEPESPEQTERRVTIVGNAEAQWKAQLMISDKIRHSGIFVGNDDIHLKVEIMVPSFLIGRIIGKKGQNIKELQRITGAIVKIPKIEDGETKDFTAIRIMGTFFAVQSAQRRVRSILDHIKSPQNGHASKSASVSPSSEQQHQ